MGVRYPDLLHCPIDPAHLVLRNGITFHVRECYRYVVSNPQHPNHLAAKSLRGCQYYPNHWVPWWVLEDHEAACYNKQRLVAVQRLSLATTGELAVPRPPKEKSPAEWPIIPRVSDISSFTALIPWVSPLVANNE